MLSPKLSFMWADIERMHTWCKLHTCQIGLSVAFVLNLFVGNGFWLVLRNFKAEMPLEHQCLRELGVQVNQLTRRVNLSHAHPVSSPFNFMPHCPSNLKAMTAIVFSSLREQKEVNLYTRPGTRPRQQWQTFHKVWRSRCRCDCNPSWRLFTSLLSFFLSFFCV